MTACTRSTRVRTARAEQYAAAAAACSPIDPDAPTAAKQVLPTSAFYGGLGQHARDDRRHVDRRRLHPGADPVGDVDTEPVALAHGQTHEASQDDAEGDAVTRPHDEREPGPDGRTRADGSGRQPTGTEADDGLSQWPSG